AGVAKTGNEDVNLNAATITGRLTFGNGTHSLTLANNAVIGGGLAQGSGTLGLSVSQSQLTLADNQTLNVSNASFASGSKLTFTVASTVVNTIIATAGNVPLAAGTSVNATFSGILQNARTINVIQAGSLTLGAPLSQIVVNPTSFLNVASFNLSSSNTLQL